ncbi:spinster family MFS transporter [Phyllobacterium endophyticum]|uniref:spinster family MFS transporter n=1 Tax=Phyllobacterium endophyticum TaxID=1149773 RepID=UPI0011C9452C|nr:MFS transporter [Phyllobacterium endophyticum]TXR51125.1 MFS transporter [Phyllobacterium endophyticum]
MADGKQAANAWKVLFLLFLANLLNFFDRAVPAILNEPIRHEWGLSDFQLGMIAAAFTVVYAIAGLPLGRLADTSSRKKIMGWGLIVWSLFTGLNGAAWNFASFLAVRVGVGVGEAAYAPAATSMIGDMFPSHRRSRAMGIFMLGLPLGLILAFFTVGGMVKAFGSWRAPFFIAMVPGIILAIFMFFVKDPNRGAAEDTPVSNAPISRPLRKVLLVPTMWWIILAGITANFAVYSTNSFMVPLLQRYFGLALESAAITTGCIVGVTGLVGLTLGGWVADKLHAYSDRGRLLFGAFGLLAGALATGYALTLGSNEIGLFAAIFSIGWLMQYNYFTCTYAAIQDVIEPRLRATAFAVFFAALYLLGGAFGPMVVGLLSDYFSVEAMNAAGAAGMTEEFKAIGLHNALFLIPVTLFLTAVFLYFAARTFPADAKAMTDDMSWNTVPA